MMILVHVLAKLFHHLLVHELGPHLPVVTFAETKPIPLLLLPWDILLYSSCLIPDSVLPQLIHGHHSSYPMQIWPILYSIYTV